jgi:hypothetical protein
MQGVLRPGLHPGGHRKPQPAGSSRNIIAHIARTYKLNIMIGPLPLGSEKAGNLSARFCHVGQNPDWVLLLDQHFADRYILLELYLTEHSLMQERERAQVVAMCSTSTPSSLAHPHSKSQTCVYNVC